MPARAARRIATNSALTMSKTSVRGARTSRSACGPPSAISAFRSRAAQRRSVDEGGVQFGRERKAALDPFRGGEQLREGGRTSEARRMTVRGALEVQCADAIRSALEEVCQLVELGDVGARAGASREPVEDDAPASRRPGRGVPQAAGHLLARCRRDGARAQRAGPARRGGIRVGSGEIAASVVEDQPVRPSRARRPATTGSKGVRKPDPDVSLFGPRGGGPQKSSFTARVLRRGTRLRGGARADPAPSRCGARGRLGSASNRGAPTIRGHLEGGADPAAHVAALDTVHEDRARCQRARRPSSTVMRPVDPRAYGSSVPAARAASRARRE